VEEEREGRQKGGSEGRKKEGRKEGSQQSHENQGKTEEEIVVDGRIGDTKMNAV
jgi:hypothetical protein